MANKGKEFEFLTGKTNYRTFFPKYFGVSQIFVCKLDQGRHEKLY